MEKIIVADDEPIECMAINKMLNELGLPVKNTKNAHDGEELVKIAKMEKPDIAIVDINMPELNGLDAIEMLHGFVPDMKIIIHSAYHDYSYMQHAIQLGAVDYLLKPAAKQDIGRAIERALLLLKQERGIIEKNRKREDTFQQMQEAVENGIMMSAVAGEPDNRGFLIYQESHPEISADGYVLAVCPADQGTMRLTDLRTRISAWLERYCASISCIYQDTVYYEIFHSGGEEGEAWIDPVVTGIFDTAKSNRENIFIGISRCTQSFSDSDAAVREAQIAMQMCRRENPIRYYPDRSIQTKLPVSKESDFDTDAKRKEWIAERQKQIVLHRKPQNKYVKKCLIFIERNYNRDISLGDASEYAGVSSFYMTRLLKQETEKSFVQLLTDVRIHKAVCMICEDQLTNAEIGSAVGYPNPVYFNRVLKKATGMTVNQIKQLSGGMSPAEL